MPSHPVLVPGTGVLPHSGPVNAASTERKSRLFQTDTSCWAPRQAKSDSTTGLSGSAMSITRKPS